MGKKIMIIILIVFLFILFLVFGVGKISKNVCSKEGLVYLEKDKDYCVGEIKNICLNEKCKSEISCCSGKIIERFKFEGEILERWNSLGSFDACNESFGWDLNNCNSQKCVVIEILRKEFYNASVLGEFDRTCHYYEEMPEEKALYCKLDLNSRKEFGNCLIKYYSEEKECDKIVDEFLKQGICQIIER